MALITQEKIKTLKSAFNKNDSPIIIDPSCPDQRKDYDRLRKVFNRKFDFMPALIVLVNSTEQVATIVKVATENDMPFTVRSGGHDHEGESVATGKILIDFSKMKNTELVKTKKNLNGKTYLRVDPGALFKYIKPDLDNEGLGIAHGTCMTVAIAGYTLGGGWGPWTRKYGMGCERLTGATIVLGDGSVRYLGNSAEFNQNKLKGKKTDTSAEDEALFWAIRGGGGLSYGIITEFIFEPFELPEVALSFSIKKNDLKEFEEFKATDVIYAWENMIKAGRNPRLIGTNLKVVAKAVQNECDISENAILDWQFNGHFGGTCEQLAEMLEQFAEIVAYLIVHGNNGSNVAKLQRMKRIEQRLMAYFNGICKNATHHKASTSGKKMQPYGLSFEHWDQHKSFLSLENDGPSPHKITSKMPTADWCSDDRSCSSRKELVKSLQSTLLWDKDKTSVSAYITLGAITGEFYGDSRHHQDIAFPYADRPFTIQYQCWWNTTEYIDGDVVMDEETVKAMKATRFQENRGQDWIEACRHYDIPKTNGSFISFKDAGVPTKEYFGEHYEQLINTKLEYSKDRKNYFRSRKTIL